jgi:hypothetical protein
MGGSAKESQLGASLAGESRDGLRFSSGNPQADGPRKKLLLVSKIVVKIRSLEEENLKKVEELNIKLELHCLLTISISIHHRSQHRQY